jgi:hypothetical protein
MKNCVGKPRHVEFPPKLTGADERLRNRSSVRRFLPFFALTTCLDHQHDTVLKDPLTSEIRVLAIGKVFKGVQMGDFDAGRGCRAVPDFVAMNEECPDTQHEDDECRVNSEVRVERGDISWRPLRLEQLRSD